MYDSPVVQKNEAQPTKTVRWEEGTKRKLMPWRKGHTIAPHCNKDSLRIFFLNGWNKERCSYLVSLGTVKKSPVSYRPPQRIIPMFFCSTLRLCLICCGGSERMLRCVLYNQIEPIIYWPPKLLGTCSSTRCRPPLSSSPPGQRGRCRTWKGRMERRTVGQRLSGIDFFCL